MQGGSWGGGEILHSTPASIPQESHQPIYGHLISSLPHSLSPSLFTRPYFLTPTPSERTDRSPAAESANVPRQDWIPSLDRAAFWTTPPRPSQAVEDVSRGGTPVGAERLNCVCLVCDVSVSLCVCVAYDPPHSPATHPTPKRFCWGGCCMLSAGEKTMEESRREGTRNIGPARSSQCSDYLFRLLLVYSSLHIG